MSVVLHTQHTITVDGLKPWVAPDKLVANHDANTYVKLVGSSAALARLVYVVSSKEVKRNTLSNSKGLADSKQMRDETQKQDTSDEEA